MTSAKLRVPAGTFDHASGGETFSPMQFGLVLMLPAFFVASIVPSLNVDDVSEKGSAALALCAIHASAATAAAAAARLISRFSNMADPPLLERSDTSTCVEQRSSTG